MSAEILLVEDDSELQKLESIILADTATLTICDSLKAIHKALISGKKPDLILLNLDLPDGNGLDFLTEVRQKNEMRNIPIIVLTANYSPELVKDCKKLGAIDYITKPFDKNTLLESIKKALDSH